MDEQTLQVPPPLRRNIFLTSVDWIYNTARVYSLWPLTFGLACCAIEMMAAGAARFDQARFGMEVARPSPRQADLIVVAGTVTKKMVPLVVRLYNQMPEPKYVLAMGACACSGGPFKEGYNVVSGIDEFLPVDVYVPGCPPRPEALLEGFMAIHAKMRRESVQTVRWYRKAPATDCPIPFLGPDLVDPRQMPAIKAAAEAAKRSSPEQDAA
ncbi:MAG: NADH-quinone oxidoreductase subunit B [Anaerolineae bacterium]